MKRLFIIAFFVFVSVAVLSMAGRSSQAKKCPQPKSTCCKQQQPATPVKNKTDYIFWEPVNRLLMIP